MVPHAWYPVYGKNEFGRGLRGPPRRTLAQELEDRFSAGLSPFPKAESFSVHELIDPRETRARLCDWVDLIQPLLPGLLGEASLRYTP